MNTITAEDQKRTVMLLAGHGFWQTNRYPIGGEFHRPNNDWCVVLTGKKIDFGQYNGFVEFEALNDKGQPVTGFARPQAFSPQA